MGIIAKLLLLILFLFWGCIVAVYYMETLQIPHPIADYHGKETLIEHKKQIRNQNDCITQQFRCKTEVKDGQLFLLITKDGQRRITAKKAKEIQKLTMDVQTDLLVWMGFDVDKIKKMKKSQLVELICSIFLIPTPETLKIDETDANRIIQRLNQIIEEEPVIVDLTLYIRNNQTNMITIADIIDLCQEKNIDFTDYFSKLWMGLIENFEVNRDDDFEYRDGFDSLSTSNNIISLQSHFEQNLTHIFNEYNAKNNYKSMKHKQFWYALDILSLRYFNQQVKQYVIETYVEQPKDFTQDMNEQRRVAIYKFFGSSFYGCETGYKKIQYGEIKRRILLSIVDKCLLTYSIHDHNSTEEECKNEDYLKAPLRIRLQNGGYMRLIHHSFYNNIGIKMYSMIVGDVQQVFKCYDKNKIQGIEQKVIKNTGLFEEFDKHVGPIETVNNNDEKSYKEHVWKDMIHKVTSRIVFSINKRHKNNYNHVGPFRTGVKAKHAKKKKK
eukprot:378683_1